ncbi:MAG: SRPBCC family protein [Actinobacteria bacterium]|nr:SRPBCC family protein [Actinomycetota bacterium]
MAETAHERIRIEAEPQRCYEVATDFERYPEWAKDVKEVQVLERDDEGRGAKVEYRAAAMGKSTRYVLAYDFSEAPAAFTWEVVESDMLRQLDGRYGFEADDGGTRVTYDLTADPKVPLPGFIKRRVASTIIGTALKELKREVEAS